MSVPSLVPRSDEMRSANQDRAKRLREKIAISLESEQMAPAAMNGHARGAPGAGTYGLPPTLDPSLVLEAALPNPGAAWDGQYCAL